MIDFWFKKGGHPGRDRPSKMVVWNEGFTLPRLIKFYHNKNKSQRENYKYLSGRGVYPKTCSLIFQVDLPFLKALS